VLSQFQERLLREKVELDEDPPEASRPSDDVEPQATERPGSSREARQPVLVA